MIVSLIIKVQQRFKNCVKYIIYMYYISHNFLYIEKESGLLQNAYKANSISVNSLHMQGVNRLAESLVVEATAADGLIEAFRLDQTDRFVLAVQWHPEWKVTETPDYQVIFDLFAEACTERKVG